MKIRRLITGDEAALATFLAQHPHTTMHMRGNLAREGFAWEGAPHQGIYYGAVQDDGAIAGAVAYYWNGNVLMRAHEHLAPLLKALAGENIQMRGLLGPAAEVRQAIALLGLAAAQLQISKDEDVYILDLYDLKVPAALSEGRLRARGLRPDDRALVIGWRLAFNIEALGAVDTPALRREIEEEIDRKAAAGVLTILEDGNTAVAMCGRDATLPDSVTIGPVWTPPEQRGKGYARAVVAGSLRQAQALGGTHAILFTDNPAAARAYSAVGFRKVDKYGLTLLRAPAAI